MCTAYLALELKLDVVSTDDFFLSRQLPGYLIGILKHEAPYLVQNGILLYTSNHSRARVAVKNEPEAGGKSSEKIGA